MSKRAKKRPETNAPDSAEIRADAPQSEEDDFALAALDFLSEGLGSDTSPVDTGSVPDDFFDTNQLSSMAALNWQAEAANRNADTGASTNGSADTGASAARQQRSAAPDSDADNQLLDLAESLTQGVPNEAPISAEATTDDLLDLVEGLTGPTDSTEDAALLDIAESATRPVLDAALPVDEALIDLAESASDDAADALRDLAEQAAEPQVDHTAADAALDALDAADSIQTPSAADSADDALIELAETRATATTPAAESAVQLADEGPQPEAVAAPVDGGDNLLADAQQAQPDTALDDGAAAEAQTASETVAEPAELATDIETQSPAETEQDAVEAALAALDDAALADDAPISAEVDAPADLAEDALVLLEDDPIDLDAPSDITPPPTNTIPQTTESVDDLLLGAAESAVMADDALAVLDGADESVLALEALDERTDEDESASDYLDMLVASMDAQLSDAQRQETLLDLSGEAEDNDAVLEQLIVFTISGSQYAIPVANVLEVGEPPATTPIPFVPHWVRGVFNMRGDILSLVDLRAFFELDGPVGEGDEWMIVSQTSREDMTVGLLVDDITGNRQMNRRDASDLTSTLDGVFAEYVMRFYRQGDELISVLDFDKLLNSADMRQFELI